MDKVLTLLIPVVSRVEADVVDNLVTVVDGSNDVLSSDVEGDDTAVNVKRVVREKKRCKKFCAYVSLQQEWQ